MANEKPVWAIGLMSGTSLDGVDAALIKTDGDVVTEFGPAITVDYEDAFVMRLRDAVYSKGDILAVEQELTELHVNAVNALLKEANMTPADVSVIGFHGQTIIHRPKEKLTWQIGNGGLLAHKTKIDVVCDLRRADMAAGGEGAPLVPLYHAALARDMELPIAILNIGGISNVTWIGRSEASGKNLISFDILAFDMGPGNVLINEWIYKKTGKYYDANGELAKQGKVHEKALAKLLDDPFFDTHPPKSLDRNHFAFNPPFMMSKEDGAATLTEFTVAAVEQGTKYFPRQAKQWFVTGGGRHNPMIMEGLKKRYMQVFPVEALGWKGDALEAQAMAFLAVRSQHGWPLTLPTTTGSSKPVTGGAIYKS